MHGEEGLGSYVPAGEIRSPSAGDAATVIAETVRARPGEVHLVAVGPLTNVAIALELEPRLPELLGGFTLMGGAYHHDGNVAPCAEANIWMDPEAAARVFAAWSGAERLPRCVGLEVTERVPMAHGDLARACAAAPSSPLAELLTAAVGFYIDFYLAYGRPEGGSMHDALAVLSAIDPSVCGWAEVRVEVELEGRWTRGETVTDVLGLRATPWSTWDPASTALVATDVDDARVLETIVERLARLVGSRA